MESDLGRRITQKREAKGINKSKLADLAKVTATAIGQYEKGLNFPKTEVLLRLNKILNYDFINDCELHSTEGESHAHFPTANSENKGVPYYDIDFMGGFDLIFNEQQIQPSFYIDFLPFNDCDCWINATGKSMGPLIAHGDIVGLKRIENWQRFLLEGEIYAVITDNGFRTIKILGAGPDQNHYMLIPYNKSDEYQPQAIPKEVITHIFRVKGNIKKFF